MLVETLPFSPEEEAAEAVVFHGWELAGCEAVERGGTAAVMPAERLRGTWPFKP